MKFPLSEKFNWKNYPHSEFCHICHEFFFICFDDNAIRLCDANSVILQIKQIFLQNKQMNEIELKRYFKSAFANKMRINLWP